MEFGVRQGGSVRAIVIAATVLTLPGCGREKEPASAKERAIAAPVANPCGDPTVSGRLRNLIVAQARQLRTADAELIARIAGSAGVTVSHARATGRDVGLNLTLCRAQVAVDLPDGATDAFDGARRLSANLRYAVQRNGRGEFLVHQFEGAEALAYRLAAIPLQAPEAQAVASPAPAPMHTPTPTPTPKVRPTETPRARTIASVPSTPSLPSRRGLPEPALTSLGRPSFDCRRAGSRVERMICADERLAALDRVTASLYTRSLARADRSVDAELRASQASFIERRDDCRRAACVADRYRARLDEIDRLAGR